MIKPEFSKASFKAINSPKLFFLPKKAQHKRDNSQPSTFEQNPLKLGGPQVKHRRFRSCESHPEQVALMVRKEKLRDKIKQLASPVQKGRQFRIKQKTDCHNQQYLDFLKRKKAAMDWIRFNITEGIYLLWNRIKDLGNFQRAKKIPEMEKLFRKSEQMVIIIQDLNEQYSESQKQEENRDCHKQQKDIDHQQAQSIIKHSFQRSRQANKKQFRKIKNKTISFQNFNRQYERSDAQALKEHYPEPNKKSVKKNSKIEKILQLIHSCNEDIRGLNRSLINIQSEQIDISRTKHNLKTIKQLKNQLQQNQPALELIQDYIHKLQMLENSQENISATLHNLKTIQQMMGQNVGTQSSYQKKTHELTSSMFVTFKTAFSGCSKSIIKHSALSKKHLSRKNLTSSKNNQNGQTKKVRIAPANNCRVRASIELRIDSGDMPYNLYSTTVATPKNISIFKAKSKSKIASTTKQIDTKITSNNASLAESQVAIKIRKGNISKKQSDRQSKKKKSLAFQCTLQEELSQPNSQPWRKNTMKSKYKSRKQISFGSISCASFRSVRAIGSTKNIGSKKNLSNTSSTDLKQFHSFRNKREVQFIKGKLKKISLVRNYRSILFKFVKDLMGQESTVNQQQMKKDDIFKMFNITAEQLCQQNQDVQYEANIQPIEQKIQAIKGMNRILSQTMPQFPTLLVSKQKSKTKPSGPPQRKQNRKKCLKEHPDETNNAVRQFIVKCKAIQHEGSISKKKQLLSNNIQHLRASKLISTQNYLRFKAVIHRKRRSDFKPDEPIEEQTEESKRNFDHPYSCLLDMNKMIALNDTLSQTNNYYYKFSQFREHLNLVGRNIQEVDDQFFNIKTYIQQKQPIKRENIEWRQTNHRDILLQKDY